MLLTNDTYTAPGGQTLETTEAVTVGNGGGRVQTFDPKGNVQDFVTLSGFQTVYAVAGSADEGFIAGTPGIANVFVGAGNYAYMNSGPAFYYLAGAKYVYSYALSGADFAYEYDGSGPSAYVASGTAYAMMLGTDHGRSFFNEGVGFTATEGIASHPNQDVAYFYDSPGSDTFTGYAQYASLTSAGQNDAAVYFAQIYAYSFVGGTDVAYNYAPAVNHVYYLDPTTGYGFRRGV